MRMENASFQKRLTLPEQVTLTHRGFRSGKEYGQQKSLPARPLLQCWTGNLRLRRNDFISVVETMPGEKILVCRFEWEIQGRAELHTTNGTKV
jgi:hypothetical protein